MLVKKYSNRRLDDTEDSPYITLDELAVELFFPTDDASASFFGATPS